MTDWGAHHLDIAHWGMGFDNTGPTSVAGEAVHPVPYKDGYPTQDNQYNTATQFNISCQFDGGKEIIIRDRAKDLGFDNGILFEGTRGRLFVNRGKITGKAVEELKDRPLPEDALVKVYKGKQPGGGNAHMRNFFECIASREQPISDVSGGGPPIVGQNSAPRARRRRGQKQRSKAWTPPRGSGAPRRPRRWT